jgi:hypothetical protein
VVDSSHVPNKKPTRDENRFELIYREENVWAGTLPINHRRPFDLDLAYPFPELKPFIGKMNNTKTTKSYKAKIFIQ